MFITAIGVWVHVLGERRPWTCSACIARRRTRARHGGARLGPHTPERTPATNVCFSATHPHTLMMPSRAARDRHAPQTAVRRSAQHGPLLTRRPHAGLQHQGLLCCGVLHRASHRWAPTEERTPESFDRTARHTLAVRFASRIPLAEPRTPGREHQRACSGAVLRNITLGARMIGDCLAVSLAACAVASLENPAAVPYASGRPRVLSSDEQSPTPVHHTVETRSRT